MTSAPALSDQDYARFRRLIDEKSGLDFPPSRRIQLEHAIDQAVARTGLSDPSALYHKLRDERGRKELESFVASLTVGETHFFRNRPQFEALKKHILPELIRRRSQERRLRIWSAGCSSGEEPYSLAMLLDRLIPNLRDWNVLILATDIDRAALKKAHGAIYGPWSFREVPEHFESRYFIGRGRDREVAPRIREMVTFEYLNLVEDRYPSLLTNTNAMDLVLCRNVFIYFRHEVARSVTARLYDAISDEGWLLVGHAEPSQLMSERFSIRNFPGTAVYQRTPTSERRRTPDRRQISDRRQPPERRTPDRRQIPDRRQSPDRRRHLQPEEPDVLADALKLSAEGYVEHALSILEKAAAEDPRDATGPYLIAKIQAGRLHMDSAEQWVAVALDRDRLFAPAHYLRGLISEEDGRSDEASQSLRRCVYADPKWALGHFALAGSLLRLGQRRRAISALHTVEQLLEGRPDDEPIPEGDGITVARLRELVGIQREIFGLEASDGGDR